MNTKPDIDSENELIDKVVNKVIVVLGNNKPVKRLRRSQLLTALLGATGFALLTSGIQEIFTPFHSWSLVLMGLILMTLTGLLLQNLNR